MLLGAVVLLCADVDDDDIDDVVINADSDAVIVDDDAVDDAAVATFEDVDVVAERMVSTSAVTSSRAAVSA